MKAFEEHSTYSSALFVGHLVKSFPCLIECIQTDNRTEFTNRFTANRGKFTLFQGRLERYGIRHNLICPYTLGHNAKVKYSYRKGIERIYAISRYAITPFSK